jgi:propanol-preferring alcohol dehydrogenase
VANFTRDDAHEFLELAATIPIRTATQAFALRDANVALRNLASGDLEATAVLVV